MFTLDVTTPGIWPNKWTIRFLVAVLCSWPSIVGLTRGDALSYYLSWSGLLFQLAGLCVAVVGIYKLMRAFDRWFRNILFPMITVSASLSMPYNAVSDLVFEVSPVDSSLDDRVSRLASQRAMAQRTVDHSSPSFRGDRPAKRKRGQRSQGRCANTSNSSDGKHRYRICQHCLADYRNSS